jgi:ABC-type bacteriocin/lantibiotic exporter with double-glycine peptidase domain
LNLAPAATFAVYVIISVYWLHGSFLTAQAFTSLALIGLLTSPMTRFIQSLPQVLQCVGSFNRIQEYCNSTEASLKDENYYDPGHTDLRHESEIHLLAPDGPSEPFDAPHDDAISLHSQGFKWNKSGPVILKDIQIDIDREAITAITGPVGSGKSSFLSSILGEMIDTSSPESQQRATQQYCKHIAYCSQQPWLENTTIRQNIVSSSSYEKKWYDEVIFACGLDADLKQLQRGDQTNVGSRGLNLSGGQKQRIVSDAKQLHKSFHSGR